MSNTIAGVTFKDDALLTEALTHRSFLNENKSVKNSNERLEFLGDSVLSLVTSTELFRRFPDLPEGKLTTLRSSLVRAKTLSQVAKKLNLGARLYMSRGEEKSGGRANPTLLANAFEALLGAVYLDQGLAAAEEFLSRHIFPLMPKTYSETAVSDAKSKLQEVIQEKKRVSPTYRVLTQSGPDHDRTFLVAVLAGKTELGRAGGKSKQEAEEAAATVALEALKP